jgi:hypothetical protein
MARSCFPAAIIILLATSMTVMGAAPPANPGHPFPDLAEILGRSAKRTNGALLQTTAQADEKELKIKWTIDYNGPRPPLTTLEPTLTELTFGQTVLRVYARGRDNKRYDILIASPASND